MSHLSPYHHGSRLSPQDKLGLLYTRMYMYMHDSGFRNHPLIPALGIMPISLFYQAICPPSGLAHSKTV